MTGERKWHYTERLRGILAQRFGEELLPVLDTAAALVRDIERTPPNTVEQCRRASCGATRIRIIWVGTPQWSDVNASSFAGDGSECGIGNHDWRTLGLKKDYC